MTICYNKFCKKETLNKKFCSRNCSATVNNKIPKRKAKIKICHSCFNEFKIIGDKYCQNCKRNKENIRKKLLLFEEKTLEDLCNEYRKNKIHRSWWFSEVRIHNRKVNFKKREKCFNCGYSKHVELAHIRAISSFELTAKIKDVNHENNVVGLCPNCHWEFDHGLLILNF